jgi:hypothetical protein
MHAAAQINPNDQYLPSFVIVDGDNKARGAPPLRAMRRADALLRRIFRSRLARLRTATQWFCSTSALTAWLS